MNNLSFVGDELAGRLVKQKNIAMKQWYKKSKSNKNLNNIISMNISSRTFKLHILTYKVFKGKSDENVKLTFFNLLSLKSLKTNKKAI